MQAPVENPLDARTAIGSMASGVDLRRFIDAVDHAVRREEFQQAFGGFVVARDGCFASPTVLVRKSPRLPVAAISAFSGLPGPLIAVDVSRVPAAERREGHQSIETFLLSRLSGSGLD